MARAHLILDRYEPLGMAGSGGFGTVQIAWDPRIQRKVAIKTIQLTEQDAFRAALPGAQAVTKLAVSPTADRWHGVQPWNEYLKSTEDSLEYEENPPETFHALANLPGLDEARTAAMLADPRIVTVYDFEVRERTAYLIMEYVEGITLTRLLVDYADWLTLDVVAAVFDAVAGALQVAHENSVLHLDIKPDNILINAKGEVKVTDFGLATLADASGAGTTGGGTIGYMPLEQMRREDLDARTDEWSLASVTYEMLTGENPFHANSLSEAEQAIEEAELVLPSLCWENIDDQIDDVVFYALDPDREERYDSIRDFAEEADKFLGNANAGRAQLIAIVEDALGYNDEPEEEPEEEHEEPRPGRGRKLIRSLFSAIGASPASDMQTAPPRAARTPEDDRYDDEEEPAPEARSRRTREPREAKPHRALRDRVGGKTLGALAVAFAAIASGAVGAFAAWNIPLLTAFGAGRIAIVAALALAAAALAIVRPHIGALASFCLMALALALNGGLVPAIVLAVALVAWWYFAARDSVAASNVALASPLLGAVGAGCAAPLFAGATLRPVKALITSAFAAVCAIALASIGSQSLLGWDAMSHWTIADGDMTATFVAIITQPATWCIVASWLGAALVQSLLSTSGRRWMEIAGLVLGAAVIIAMSVLFGQPALQIALGTAVGAICILAAIL